jgi:hypothetical protein
MLLPLRQFGLCFDSRPRHDLTAVSDLSLWIGTSIVVVVVVAAAAADQWKYCQQQHS